MCSPPRYFLGLAPKLFTQAPNVWHLDLVPRLHAGDAASFLDVLQRLRPILRGPPLAVMVGEDVMLPWRHASNPCFL